MHKNFHNLVLGVSVLPALLVMPAVADYTWAHPDIDSYSTINSNVNKTLKDVEANVFTGTAMRNIVNGNVGLVLDGITQAGTQEINGVYGNVFYTSSQIATLQDATAPTDEQKVLRQYVDGDVSVVVKNNSSVARNVIGNQFYIKAPDEIDGNVGLSGKTMVTISDSSVAKSVRGANIGDVASETDAKISNLKVEDIEINIDNSFVKDEVISTGSYISAGNVKINVTGDSVIGYTAADSDVATSALTGGSWIIAGVQRNDTSVKSTEVNLNTAGTIRVAGDVNAGSRERSEYNSNTNSVIGDATLNMLGGGNIEIGGDVRAYHVGGKTTLNLTDINATVVGNVKEFQTINMDENSVLTADSLIMKSSDTVNVVLADTNKYSRINVNTLDANGAALNMTVRKAGTYDVVTVSNPIEEGDDFTWNLNNAMFDLAQESGTVTATVKSAESIAGKTGLAKDSAQTIAHVAKSDSAQLQELSLKLQEKLAGGDTASVEHVSQAINPETKSVSQSVSSSVQNAVVSLASARMASPSVGRNGGDVELTSGGVWAQGLFNKSKQADAFNGYTRGIAVGMDGTINKDWTIGAGYSFAHSDVTGTARDTEIDSNTVFVYGQYKPSQWYVNAIANYTMSDYSERGTILDSIAVTGDYDVNSFGGALATGYDFANGITPELGLRYMHVNANDYANSYGIKTHMDDTDFLTGVAGLRYAFDIAATKHMTFAPQLSAAAKYDMLSDKNVATVTMPGLDAYTLEGSRLNRIGGEFGIGLGMQYRSLEMSVNYDIDVREDYTSQTGMLKFRYNF